MSTEEDRKRTRDSAQVSDQQQSDIELTPGEKQALRIATTTELTAERIASLKPRWRAFSLWLYQPSTEIAVSVAILLSVSFALYEVFLSPNPLSFGVSPDEGEEALRRTPILFWVDVGLSVFFLAEYIARLSIAPKKWPFIKSHVIDVIALIPILRLFRLARLLRLIRLLRVFRIIRVGSMATNSISELWNGLRPSTGEQAAVLAYLGFSLTLGTAGIMVFERNAGSGYDSVADGIWWTLVTVTTVGYGDITPVTLGGRVVGGFLMIVGLSLFGVITGMISKSLINRSQSEGTLSTKDLREHLIICGWSDDDTLPILNDAMESHDYDGVVIITNRSLEDVELPSAVRWIKGDPTELQTLERANMAFARAVIILAERREGMTAQDVDARSILIAMAVDHVDKKIHVLVQLLRDTNRKHCATAGVDEVIVASQFDSTVLRKAARYPGTSRLYDDFLGANSDASLHIITADEDAVGKTFVEVSRMFIEDSRGIPIGIKRDEERIHDPAAGLTIIEGDEIMVVRPYQSLG